MSGRQARRNFGHLLSDFDSEVALRSPETVVLESTNLLQSRHNDMVLEVGGDAGHCEVEVSNPLISDRRDRWAEAKVRLGCSIITRSVRVVDGHIGQVGQIGLEVNMVDSQILVVVPAPKDELLRAACADLRRIGVGVVLVQHKVLV